MFHRQWQTLVLRAHGHTPTWGARLNYQGPSDDSQQAFRAINLRWHDLRHEYASRLVEHGVPLAQGFEAKPSEVWLGIWDELRNWLGTAA